MSPNNFSCSVCGKTFKYIFSMKRHYANVHPGNVDEDLSQLKIRKRNLICGICRKSFNCSVEFFNEHLRELHDVVLKTQVLEFQSVEDFESWKKNVQHNENSNFVKQTATRLHSDKRKVTYYACHRSGFHRTIRTPRIRATKKQGSYKINSYCPARIKCETFEDGRINVEFCRTHVGHASDIEDPEDLSAHSSSDNKQLMVGKHLSTIPDFGILESAFSSVRGYNPNCNYLITNKDLDDIEREFLLHGDTVVQSEDSVTVEMWVEKEQSKKNSCVLLYKPQGICMPDKYPNLRKEDFVLGIMTEIQAEILKKYGSDCICMDYTPVMTDCNFEMLSTLLVFDKLVQGFPCAFLISNRHDKYVIETFLNAVKDAVGIVRNKIFMSDMTDVFYDAWANIMGKSELRLVGTWHVDRDWRKNLIKIKDVELRKETYKKLIALLEEIEEEAFQSMLGTIIEQLCENEPTKPFGLYFQKYYASSYKEWSHCYRTNASIYLKMHLEILLNAITHLYCKGKAFKRLDRSIHAIMQLMKNKLFAGLTALDIVQLTGKLDILLDCHKRSLTMDIDQVIASNSNDSWDVYSSNLVHVFTVKLVEPLCDCLIVCKHCEACIHKYSCTCIDASIKWNMCWHIHLVCQSLQKIDIEVDQPESAGNDESLMDFQENAKSIHEKTVSLLEADEHDYCIKKSTVEELKMQCTEEFASILKGLNTVEEMNVIKNLLNSFSDLEPIKRYRSLQVMTTMSTDGKMAIDPSKNQE